MAGRLSRVAASKHLTLTNLFDLLKLAFAVVAGIGGVVALVVAYRRQQVAEDANRIAQKKNELDHAADLRATEEHQRGAERLFHERFQKASEQLGHDAAAVRLAGVYAMASLADDWADHRQTCIDVLCAYLRMHFNPDPPDDPDHLATWHGERQVRQTVVRVITAHLRDSAPTSWQGHDLDFTGAVFADGDSFSDTCFAGGNIRFSLARFHGGRVTFNRAKFTGGTVIFNDAQFNDGTVSFFRAQFTGGTIYFLGAQFAGSKVDFNEARFAGGAAYFMTARFTGGSVNFQSAEFTGGLINFLAPDEWKVPPIFGKQVHKRVPEGLLLPEGWREGKVSAVEGDGKE